MKKIFLILVLIFNEIVFSQPSLWPPQDGKIVVTDQPPTAVGGQIKLLPMADKGVFVYWLSGSWPGILAWSTRYDKWGNKLYPNADRLFPLMADEFGNVFGKKYFNPPHTKYFRKIDASGNQQWGDGIDYSYGFDTPTSGFQFFDMFSDNNGGMKTLCSYSSPDSLSITLQHYYPDGTTEYPWTGKILASKDSTHFPHLLIPSNNPNQFYVLHIGGGQTLATMMDTSGNFLWQNWLMLAPPSTTLYPNQFDNKHVLTKVDENNNLQMILYKFAATNTVDTVKAKHFKVSPTGILLEEHTFSPEVGLKYFDSESGGYQHKVIPTNQGFIVLKGFSGLYGNTSNFVKLLFHITHEGNIIFCANDSTGSLFSAPMDIENSVDSTFWVRAGDKAMRFDYNFNPVLAAPITIGFTTFPYSQKMTTDGAGGFYNAYAENGSQIILQHVSKNGLFDEVLSDKEPVNKPQTYDLLEIYPNPFNPTTKIVYATKSSGKSKITVYNTLGQKIRSWNLNKNKGEIVWNGTDTNGKQVASGVYLVNLVTKNNTTTKKITMLK